MLSISLKLPNSFFDEEIRAGYTISSEMKKVWAVELDLLNEFIRVCREYDIRFFAAGGTILGTVRHKGFIPWDDDIDLMMFRRDYNRLCEIAPKAFQHPYFFQTEETDPGSYRGHAQLRNCETTGILELERNSKRSFNQGIFIDIFPLDNIPDNSLEKQTHMDLVRCYRKKYLHNLRWLFPLKFRKNIILLVIDRFISWVYSKDKICHMIEKNYTRFTEESIKYNNINTQSVIMTPFSEERWIICKKDMESVVNMPFEMLIIPIPSGYNNILNSTYGNWKDYVIGGSKHGGVFFDTERSYTYYLNQNNK